MSHLPRYFPGHRESGASQPHPSCFVQKWCTRKKNIGYIVNPTKIQVNLPLIQDTRLPIVFFFFVKYLCVMKLAEASPNIDGEIPKGGRSRMALTKKPGAKAMIRVWHMKPRRSPLRGDEVMWNQKTGRVWGI